MLLRDWIRRAWARQRDLGECLVKWAKVAPNGFHDRQGSAEVGQGQAHGRGRDGLARLGRELTRP